MASAPPESGINPRALYGLNVHTIVEKFGCMAFASITMANMGQGSDIYDFDNIRRWISPGPVSDAFLKSTARIPFIVGPVGSAKSTTADVVKPFTKMILQKPGNDGVRHYRLVTFRNTQRNAWKSTIPTFMKWVPREIGTFTGSEDRPCRFNFKTQHPEDGGLINVELWWFGVPSTVEELEASLKGLETSDINFAEADQIPRFAFEWANGRIGRHPSGPLGKCVLEQLWGSLNASTFENWVYDVFVDSPLPGLELYHQPSGLLSDKAPFITNPRAENLINLPDNYYVDQAKVSRPGYIKHALMAKFGPVDGDGFLVYPEFVSQDHVVDFKVRDDWLYLGIDAGGTPAAVLMQHGPNGEIDTIDEVVIYDPKDEKRRTLRTGVGPTQFGEECLRVLSRYQGLKIKVGFIDPAAFNGGDKSHGDLAFADRLARVLDTRIEPAPAPGNSRVYREEANRLYFSKRGEGGRPMKRVHPRARWLCQGYRGEFLYESITKGGVLVPNDLRQVVKNKHSHVCEADEYGACGLTGGGKILRLPARKDGMFTQAKPAKQYKSGGIKW